MNATARMPAVLSPFPGLRPFEAHEWRIYFGREKQTDELIRRLSRTRFLGVVGTSGSGKSSLIRAGLIPSLKRGLMPQSASGWRIAVMKPGAGPFKELDFALGQHEALGPGSRIETLLRSSLGLVEAVRQVAPGSTGQFLVVVDQFEEIFRYRRETGTDEADEFVRLLLETSAQVEIPIHVVLTMRSDFLGECSQFRDLPEALNHGQYLVPRLTRDQLREAIEGPVFWANAEVTPQLVQRLLNDAGDDPDQLPILQHTLLRTWTEWEQEGRPGPLDIRHYEATGMMADALNHHAESIYQNLEDRVKPVARRMFQRLCEKTDDGKDIRRPTRVKELVEVTGATEKDIIDIVECFRAPGATFLMPPFERALNSDSQIDLSHESLIRQWKGLQSWVKEEAESAKIYRRLSEAAELRARGQARLWGGADLSIALRARKENGWNAAWARRYPGSYEVTERFLSRSFGVRWAWRALVGLMVMAVGLSSVLFWRVSEAAKANEEKALEAEALATENRVIADEERTRAVEQARLAKEKETEAVEAREGAEAERTRADAERARAAEQARMARAALANQLAAQAGALLGKNPQQSLLLAAEAVNVSVRSGDPRISRAEDVLRQALAGSGGRPLRGHDAPVTIATISPNNRWLLTAASGTDSVRVWDLTASDPTTAPIVLLADGGSITAGAITPDNKWFVAGYKNGAVRLWDLTSPGSARPPLVWSHGNDAISTVTISPDGRWLVTTDDARTLQPSARLWSLTVSKEVQRPRVLAGHRAPESTGRRAIVESKISQITISADSRWLVTAASNDANVLLWDLSSYEPATSLISLGGHDGRTTRVATSPDSGWLVTLSKGTVRLWSLKSPAPAASPVILPDQPIEAFAFGDRLLVTARGGTLRCWSLTDSEAPKPVRELDAPGGPVNLVQISPNGRWLFITFGANVRRWDFEAPDPARTAVDLKGHEKPVSKLAFTSDGRWLVSVDGATARLWSMADPAWGPSVLRGHEGQIAAMALSTDNHWLVTCAHGDSVPRLWDLTARNSGAAPDPIEVPGHSPVFSRDNRWLVAADGATARVWDLTTRSLRTPTVTLSATRAITLLAISPDRGRLVTVSGVPLTGTPEQARNNDILVWDLTTTSSDTRPTVLTGHQLLITSLALSPDGRWLATGSWDKTARLWDLTTKRPASGHVVLRHRDTVEAVAFIPGQGRLLTSSRADRVRTWVLTGDEPVEESRLRFSASRLAISPDSRWLVAAEYKIHPLLWDLTTRASGARPVRLESPKESYSVTGFAFSPDNRWLAVGSNDKRARVWDLWKLRQGDPVPPSAVLNHDSEVESVEFSPDNRILVTGCSDRAARLWELALLDRSQSPIVLGGHSGRIDSVKFSSDGSWLAAGSSFDGATRLWSLHLKELVDLACWAAGRNLTDHEWKEFFGGEPYRAICPAVPR